ncbi:alanine--glyoxylate aminotransferase family protein [Candidatus Gottesmanbacteria bacterium]|nr:alanine--glyoxylate aminotransferase family protein [Candidatus Gottesmanbacteria bacterium]
MNMINLRIPGPTPLPPEVLAALGTQMISHRSSEYRELHAEVAAGVGQFFQTKNDVFLFTSSGTGAMEAAVVNTLSPGDKALGISIGTFGDRFMDVVKAHGIDLTVLTFPMGNAADPVKVADAYAKMPDCKAILITHNETSTAIANDLVAITQAVRVHGNPLFLVDAVSSMGNVDIPVDTLGLDVVFTSSQKAWMTPPGLAMVSVSPKAWEAYKTAQCRRYYFDFGHMKKYHQKHETPETPAVAALFALRAALRVMLGKGVAETFLYYRELADYTRKRLTDAGFQLFGDQSHASNTVTACLLPAGASDEDFRGILKKQYGVVVSGGMGDMKGKIFRVAHMGWVSREDIDQAVGAMEKVRDDKGTVR